MARPPRFTSDDILDGAARALHETGPALTIADVARASGAPAGSIYHRFESREEILARLWIRSIERFHVGLLEAYRITDAAAAIDAAALHIPKFCRAHPLDATAMTLFRQPVLAAGGPPRLRETAASINEEVDDACRDLTARRYGTLSEHRVEVVLVATRRSPYGLVRPFVGGDIPAWFDQAVVASARAIAALGD